MKQVDYLIVGAGISGITSALTILSYAPKAKILIVDGAAQVGGLLRSEHLAGMYFDLGTHIPEKTAYDELNNMLFPTEYCQSWQQLPRLDVGNFFNGQLNERSQFLDITSLPSLAEQVHTELLELPATDDIQDNLSSYLINAYGSTLTQSVLAPLLFKLTALPLEQLSINTPKHYGLSRVICGNREQSIELKKSPQLDKVLAYADDAESPRQSLWFYPKEGGVGAWVELLAQKIIEQGARFLFKTVIKNIDEFNNIQRVQLSNEELVHVNKIIWTVPVYLGLKAVEQSRPLSRAISILHFYANRAPISRCHYVYCHEASFQSYRITLYSNIEHTVYAERHRCSVEIIHDSGNEPSPENITTELKMMNLFSSDTHLTYVGCNSLSAGFPLPLAGSEQQRLSLFKSVCDNNPSVTFIGRAKPQLFFMTDVLVDSYLETKKLFNDKGVEHVIHTH